MVSLQTENQQVDICNGRVSSWVDSGFCIASGKITITCYKTPTGRAHK